MHTISVINESGDSGQDPSLKVPILMNHCDLRCKEPLVLNKLSSDPDSMPSLVFPTENELAHLCLVEYLLKAGDNCIHNCIERCTMGVLSPFGCYEQAKNDLTVKSNYLVNKSRRWRLLATFCERGHHSAAFLNTVNFHLTIVHRGTQNLRQLAADIFEVTNHNEIKSFAKSAFQFTKWAVCTFGGSSSSITVTGHSLGGYLAQAATCLMKYQQPTQGWLKLDINNPGMSVTKYTLTSPELNENSYHLHCVAFDSPGYRDLFESIAMFPKYQDDRLELHRVLDSVDVSVYLTTSKIANPMNQHLGSLFLMNPVNAHGIADIVSFWIQFDDPNSQVKLEKVVDWFNTKNGFGHVRNWTPGVRPFIGYHSPYVTRKTELFNPLEFRISILNESEQDFIRVISKVRQGILSPGKAQEWGDYFIGLPEFELLFEFQIMKLSLPANVKTRVELLSHRNDSIRKFKVKASQAVRSEIQMEIGHRNYLEWLYISKTQEYLEKLPRFQNVRRMTNFKQLLTDANAKLLELICPEEEGLQKICAAMAYELFLNSSFQLGKQDEVKCLFTDSASLLSLNSVLHSGEGFRNLEFVLVEFSTQEDTNILAELITHLSRSPNLRKFVLLRKSGTDNPDSEWHRLVVPRDELEFDYGDLSFDYQQKLDGATVYFKGVSVALTKLIDLSDPSSSKLIPMLIGVEPNNVDLGIPVPKLESQTFSEKFYVERTISLPFACDDNTKEMIKTNPKTVFVISSESYEEAMAYLSSLHNATLNDEMIVTWSHRSKFEDTVHRVILDLNHEADWVELNLLFESKGIPACWICLEDKMVVDFQGNSDTILFSKPVHQIQEILSRLYESDRLRFFISVTSSTEKEMFLGEDVLFFDPSKTRIETCEHKYVIFDNGNQLSLMYDHLLQTFQRSEKDPGIVKVNLCGKVPYLQVLFNLAYKKSIHPSETQVLLDDMPLILKHQLVLIADEPGMGKSVGMKTLASRCHSTLQSELWNWTIFVELQKCRDEFSALRNFDFATCTTFLASIESLGHSQGRICAQILQILLQRAGRVFILLDGFDEINEDLQANVKNFVTTLLNNSKARIFISTRLHMKNDLESSFNVKAHKLNPLTPLQSVQFLKKFWISKLPQDSTAKAGLSLGVEEYADFILNEFRRRIVESDASKFIGIPLQMYMLATVCIDSFMEYHKHVLDKSSSMHPFLMDNFCPDYFKNILLLYKTFIEKNFEIAMFTKDNLREHSNIFFSSACIEKFVRIHSIFGFSFIFGTEIRNKYFPKVQVTLSSVDVAGLLLGNLVQSFDSKRLCELVKSVDDLCNGDVWFLHRTIAEYFAADFILSQLKFSKEGKSVVQKKGVLQFCNDLLFLKKHDIIRYFVDQMIIHSEDSHPIFRNITNLIQGQVDHVPVESLEDLQGEDPILDCFGRTAAHYFVLCMKCCREDWEKSLHRSIFLNSPHLLGVKDDFGATPFSYIALNPRGYIGMDPTNLVLFAADIFTAGQLSSHELFAQAFGETSDQRTWKKITRYFLRGQPDSEMKKFVFKSLDHFRDPSIVVFYFKRRLGHQWGLSKASKHFAPETWKELISSSINSNDNERLDLLLNLFRNNISEKQTDIKKVVEDLLRKHGLPLGQSC